MRSPALLTAAWLPLLLAQTAGCKKKGPSFDLPLYPSGMQLSSGGNVEDETTLCYHVMMRSPDSLGLVRNFYNEELVKKQGWKRTGPGTFEDGNLEHTGDFGSNGFGKPRDPTQPGGWVGMEEGQNEIRIDLWRCLPKASPPKAAQ